MNKFKKVLVTLETMVLLALTPVNSQQIQELPNFGDSYRIIAKDKKVIIYMKERVANNLSVIYEQAVRKIPFSMLGTWTDSTVYINDLAMPLILYSDWDKAVYSQSDIGPNHIGIVHNELNALRARDFKDMPEGYRKRFLHDPTSIVEIIVTRAHHDSVAVKNYLQFAYFLKIVPKGLNSENYKKQLLKYFKGKKAISNKKKIQRIL